MAEKKKEKKGRSNEEMFKGKKDRLCRNCGRGYHVTFDPPPEDGVCVNCGEGGGIYQRPDDRAGAVANRLEVYREQSVQVLGFYRQRGLLMDVDGTGSVDEVFAAVVAAIDARNAGA